MLILAAIEHHARHIWATVTEALTDRARGFLDREAGDFLTKTDATKCSYCPINDGTDCTLNCECERRAYFRQQLVEREAEEEVAEPTCRCFVTEKPGMYVGRFLIPTCPIHPRTTPAYAGADPASVGTPAAEASPAGVSAAPKPAPPAGPLTLTLEQEFAAADFLARRVIGNVGYCLHLVRDMVERVNTAIPPLQK